MTLSLLTPDFAREADLVLAPKVQLSRCLLVFSACNLYPPSMRPPPYVLPCIHPGPLISDLLNLSTPSYTSTNAALTSSLFFQSPHAYLCYPIITLPRGHPEPGLRHCVNILSLLCSLFLPLLLPRGLSTLTSLHPTPPHFHPT